MTYRLVYTYRAGNDIDALDAAVKQRIGNTLQLSDLSDYYSVMV